MIEYISILQGHVTYRIFLCIAMESEGKKIFRRNHIQNIPQEFSRIARILY